MPEASEHARRTSEPVRSSNAEPSTRRSEPITCRFTITPEMVHGGHVDVGSFSRLFDLATDAFREAIGCGAAYSAAHLRGLFVIEAHLTYRREVGEAETITVETRVLGCDAKRLHLFHRMLRGDGETAATAELMLLHVDRSAGRGSAFPGELHDVFVQLTTDAVWPTEAGRTVTALVSEPGRRA